LLSQAKGIISPNIHLRELNPHLEFGDLASMGTEHTEHRLNVSYNSITAKGFGGTNVHAITWGRQDMSDQDHPPDMNRRRIVYWPGGGGALDDDVVPRKKAGYFIAGTWNRWMPEQMEQESDTSFGYTVVLGENRLEKFQIWLDGKPERKLHPPEPNCYKGREVLGPVEDAQGLRWAIDCRWHRPREDSAAEGDSQAMTDAESDRGRVGDRFRVHLRVAGKYRTVEWERLPREEHALVLLVAEGAYYIYSSWSGWTLDEMFRDDSEPGVHYLEVTLPESGGYFSIVRNEDMEQIIYPDRFHADETANVLGPDEIGGELFWFIDGSPGEVFRIEFRRSHEFGVDNKSVSWKSLG